MVPRNVEPPGQLPASALLGHRLLPQPILASFFTGRNHHVVKGNASDHRQEVRCIRLSSRVVGLPVRDSFHAYRFDGYRTGE